MLPKSAGQAPGSSISTAPAASPPRLRVLVDSAQSITRDCLSTALGTDAGLDPSTRTPEAVAIGSLNRMHPDVVVFASADRAELAREIPALRRSYPSSRLFLLLLTDDDLLAKYALQLGVDGLADSTVSREELIECVKQLATSQFVLSRDLAHRLARLHASVTDDGVRASLTRREMDVLRLLADGATNREIAAQLALSEHTVRAHLRVIMQKLQVTNRVKAAALAWHGYLADQLEEELPGYGNTGR